MAARALRQEAPARTGASALAARFAQIDEALAGAEAAPLSARKARLAAALLDDFCDHAWEAWKADPARVFGAEDVLGFRRALAGAAPAMATVMALADARVDGPRLAVQAVAVPLSAYPGLPVEDFMVSLYNGHTVMRVVITGADEVGEATEALPVLRAAADWWRTRESARFFSADR